MLSKIKPEHLDQYLDLCRKYAVFDIPHLRDAANALIFRCNHKAYNLDHLKEMDELENRWYSSLQKDQFNPDYSVYGSIYYFCEAWYCWKIASRITLVSMTKISKNLGKSIIDDMSDVTSIVDLGCGSGYTTSALTELFPGAYVTGTNFEDSYQYKIALELGTQYGFQMLPEVQNYSDLVFASEYFEHILDPIGHLKHVLDVCEPKYVITANTFSQPAIGHFNKYVLNGLLVSGATISREFGKTMRARGYKHIDANCWNNRPMYWKKTDTVSLF